MGINAKMITQLLLFDFSKAFDTISLSKLITKLRDISFSRTSLSWVRTYMFGRTQRVVTSMGYSDYVETYFGDPQGSVLGPLLFCLYINDLKLHVRVEGLRYILYTDDLQIYLQVPADQVVKDIDGLSLAARQVADWVKGASLHVNASKTKAMYFGSQYTVKMLKELCLRGVDIGERALVAFL